MMPATSAAERGSPNLDDDRDHGRCACRRPVDLVVTILAFVNEPGFMARYPDKARRAAGLVRDVKKEREWN
jgi:hypothetical protein